MSAVLISGGRSYAKLFESKSQRTKANRPKRDVWKGESGKWIAAGIFDEEFNSREDAVRALHYRQATSGKTYGLKRR